MSGVCQGICPPDQIVDEAGNCFSCPMLEEKKNNQCECIENHIRNSVGICEIQCAPN